MTELIQRTGKCLCGKVEVTATQQGNAVGVCHCSMCRNWGGGPLMTLEHCQHVQFTEQDNISVYNSSEWAERGFCRHCGTHLFYHLKGTENYVVPAGLFRNPDFKLDEQIFTDEKPAFYDFANKTRMMTGPEVFAAFSGKD
ncbi:GFA family protein [Chromatiaceae bacterium AAb-1]|nr:GFA family protein [Chromatiaceae bacterium AAb-1]